MLAFSYLIFSCIYDNTNKDKRLCCSKACFCICVFLIRITFLIYKSIYKELSMIWLNKCFVSLCFFFFASSHVSEENIGCNIWKATKISDYCSIFCFVFLKIAFIWLHAKYTHVDAHRTHRWEIVKSNLKKKNEIEFPYRQHMVMCCHYVKIDWKQQRASLF